MFLPLMLPPVLATESVAPVHTIETIVIDAVLDEPAWEEAARIDGFTTFRPNTGDPAPRARARILYDEKALYLAFEIESIPDTPLKKTLVSRDDTLFQDFVGVLLDTFNDGQRAFVFRVTPSGVQADGIYLEGDHIWMHDLSYDTIFESAGQEVEGGYIVELAIPFRSLRYRNLPEQEWGIVLTHFTPRPWGVSAWPELSRSASGVLQQAATLGPISPPEPRLNIELQPTLVGGAALDSNLALDPGLSARVGLTSSLTADLAINPDFSQIEADPDQVTANVKYPLFYEEKRPFFLEGADLFSTPLQLLYSRSVTDPSVGYKLTGRGGGWAFGGMGALDENPVPSTITEDHATGEALPGWDEDTVASRQALVSVARLRRELDRGSSVGMMATDKELIGEDTTLANRVGGVDGVLQVGDQVRIYAQGLYSQTDLEDDKRLTGPAWFVRLNRSGHTLNLELEQYGVSPGFRAENGYLKDVGRTGGEIATDLHLTDVGPFRFLGPGAKANAMFDMSGQLVAAHVGPAVEGMLGDGGYFRSGGGYQKEVFQGREFDLWKFRGHAGLSPTTTTGLGIGWRIGPQPHYDAEDPEDPEDLYRGFSWRGSMDISQSLLDRLRLEYKLITERFSREPTSPIIYNTTLHRFRANMNFTRELSVRWITDYDSSEDSIATSALFAWQLNYGTAAYIGTSGTRWMEGTFPDELAVFAKLSWLWRP